MCFFQVDRFYTLNFTWHILQMMCKITNLIEVQLTQFLMFSFLINYALLKKRGLVIVETVWSS